jgi:C-terminal processing protease CtpA/Prc
LGCFAVRHIKEQEALRNACRMSMLLKSLTSYLTAAFLLITPAYSVGHPQEVLTPGHFTEDFEYLWAQLRDNYAYFDQKETDWKRVLEVYRPKAAGVADRREFVTFLERVLDELYDPHTHLKVNTARSTRLIPTGLDVWAEWRGGKAVITQLRKGFSAEQAGLRAGMEITSVNGVHVEKAVRGRLGVSLRTVDDDAKSWALRALLAGTRDTRRVIEARNEKGVTAVFKLDLPEHTTVDNYQAEQKVRWEIRKGRIGYVRISDLGSEATVAEFDIALERLKRTRGLIIDLRATPSGGNTSVAEPIMGRLIARRMPYQKGALVRGDVWTREVSPRGDWTYKAPVVVLVGRWTASMGEGMAIGLDGMKRATVVGTRMAGLNGAVFDLQLPNTGIKLNYAAEKLFHVDGTPREDFVPPVLVNLTGKEAGDSILEVGVRRLNGLLSRQPNRS